MCELSSGVLVRLRKCWSKFSDNFWILLCTWQYDPEGFGEIPWDDFLEVLNKPEFIAEVDVHKRDILLERAQERSTTAITFQDFVNVVSRFPRFLFFALRISILLLSFPPLHFLFSTF
jgi:hypothetical protein